MQTAKDLLLKSAESADTSAWRLENMVAEARTQAARDAERAAALRADAVAYRTAAEALPK